VPIGKDGTCGNRFGQQFGELLTGTITNTSFHFGYNLKVTEMQAAIGCAQLEKLPPLSSREEELENAEGTSDHLGDRFVLPEATDNSDPSWFGFLLTVRESAGYSRDTIVNHLEGKGIQTRMLFAGNLIKHPCFDDMRRSGSGYRTVGDLPVTDRIMRNTFWLGVYPGMTEEMVEFVARQLQAYVK